jgi:hypothetical protein
VGKRNADKFDVTMRDFYVSTWFVVTPSPRLDRTVETPSSVE